MQKPSLVVLNRKHSKGSFMTSKPLATIFAVMSGLFAVMTLVQYIFGLPPVIIIISILVSAGALCSWLAFTLGMRQEQAAGTVNGRESPRGLQLVVVGTVIVLIAAPVFFFLLHNTFDASRLFAAFGAAIISAVFVFVLMFYRLKISK